MDILIKSFNRPFYLDRCISSIYKFVSGDFSIKVLDDGTPVKYLTKIQEKYPDITIIKSDNYHQKCQAIDGNLKRGTEINGFQIPTKLWKEAALSSSDYFIMTEDDVWFTKDICISETEKVMVHNKIFLLKLGWISNRKIKSKETPIKNSNLISIKPKIFIAPSYIMNYFFDNKFKLFSLLYKLKMVDNTTKNEYWIMNSLLMGVYSKKYWLALWENIDGKVDELQQIKNAVKWFRKNKRNTHSYTRLDKLIMNTTFISSATNSYHQYGYNCDINVFNHIMNEEWFNENFNSLQNFPSDFSANYIKKFLDKANNERCSYTEWLKWSNQFKQQYRDQDVIVD